MGQLQSDPASPRDAFEEAEVQRDGSLQGLMLGFLRDLERRNYSGGTVQTRKRYLLGFASWLAERDVRDHRQVTRPMIERYQRWLFHYRRTDGTPLTVAYQSNRVRAISLLFRWAVRKHLVPANPASDLDYPRPIRTLPAVLTAEEAAEILGQPDTSTALGLRDRSILETLYSTGIRRAELAALRFDDIDMQRGVVRVVQGKGKKDRLAPIGDRAVAWLQQYLDDARPVLLHRATEPDAVHALVYLSKSGRSLNSEDLTAKVRQYVQAAGVAKPGSCHLFRHTMATVLHEAGCDVRLIQEMLGHARLDTTALYTHVGAAHLKAAHAAFHPMEQGGVGVASAPMDDDAGPDDPGEPGTDADRSTPSR